MSASGVDQRCWTSEGLGRSPFFHYLIEGLRGKAAGSNGRLTLDQLYAYVQKNVKDWVWNAREAVQEPLLIKAGSSTGSDVFVASARDAKAPAFDKGGLTVSPALPVRCIALRTPFGLDHGSISIANDHIVIVSGLGERLLVDWHGTTIVDVQPALRAALSRQVIRSSLVADGSTIWVQGYTKEDLSDLMLQVIDARTGRVRNTVAGCRAYSFYPGERGLRIWAQNEGRLGRMDLEGRLIDPQIAIAGKLVSFNAAVEDDGVWTLSVERELGLEFGPILTRFDENGRRRAGLRLGDAIGSVWSELSAVRGGCFLRARGDAAVCRVWAIRDHGDSLEVAWAFDAPDSAALVDSIAGDAVCLLHQARPLAMWPLSLDAPPPMAAGPSDTDEAVTPNFALFTRPRPTDPAIAELFTKARRELSEHVRTGGLESHIGRELARADAKTLWAHALAIDDAHAIQALRLFERATVLAPTERAIARDRAQLCIAIGRFAEAITIIERALARGAADANVCLELPLAAAQYCIEDLQRARMTLAAALERIAPTHPNRAACASFAAFLDDAYGSRAHETRVGRRVRALVEAQRLAAAGDLPGAIGVADIADVWRPRESGALALLADLWRALEPATPAEHVRRSLVLAAAAAPSSEPRGVLVVPRSPERST